MINQIKVIDNFIDEADAAKAIAVIEELMDSADIDPESPDYDSRFIFWRPEQKDAVDFVKKYSLKSQENYAYSPDSVIHDVIFAKSLPGAKLEVHMDFNDIETCKECTHASVLYLNKDYSGAEIYFPEFDESYSPGSGTGIMFPQDDELYRHGVTELLSGERYMVNMCFTKNPAVQYEIYK